MVTQDFATGLSMMAQHHHSFMRAKDGTANAFGICLGIKSM